MPELPEVETTRRGLAPWVEQGTLQQVVVRDSRLRWPVMEVELRSLIGQQVKRLERRAKYLLFHFDGSALLLHLGMSGSLRVLDPEAPQGKHDHLDFLFRCSDGGFKVIRFNDPRRFGCCLVMQPPILEHPLLSGLGPEPLLEGFSGAHLYACSRGKKQAVKNFIMDGKVVVGVGNIYASEALFMAGIRPGIAAGRVTAPRYEKLASAIRAVLKKAIIAGGTTLNDFTQSDGQPGYFRHELQVYGRAGEACLRCTSTVRSRVIGQRNTFYCANCQS